MKNENLVFKDSTGSSFQLKLYVFGSKLYDQLLSD